MKKQYPRHEDLEVRPAFEGSTYLEVSRKNDRIGRMWAVQIVDFIDAQIAYGDPE